MNITITKIITLAKTYKHLLTTKTAAVVIAVLSVLGYGALVIAAPLYNPGQTLSPTCDPSNPNCTVFPMAIGAGVALATPGSIPFIDANGALQQDNANLMWNDVTKTLTLSKGLVIGNISVADSVSAGYEILGGSTQVPNHVISGNYIYAANTGSFSFDIYDITDPTNLALAGSVSLGGPAITMAQGSGGYFYTVDPSNAQLRVLNASNPASPTLSSSVAVGANPIRVFTSGSYLYVVSRDPKVEVFDISNPASPALAGSVTLSGVPDYAALSGNYIYLMGSNGFMVVDISTPASPAEVGSLSGTSAGSQIHVNGNYVYTFDLTGSTSLDVIDVSNPASPTLVVDSLPVGDCPSDMTFYGNYIYIAHCNPPEPMVVVDISTPASANVVSSFDSSGGAYSATTFGAYLFSTESSNSTDVYKVWDLSTPTSPSLLATKSIAGDYYLGKPVINGSYAYFVSQNDYLLYSIDMTQLADIYNPNDIVSLSVDGTIQSTLLAGGGIVALYADNNGNIIPSYSDQTLKKNISDLGLTDSMNKVRALQGHQYNWKDADRFGPQTEIGFIAQEVEQVVPEVVRQMGGYKTVNYQYLSALHNEAIKALDLRLATIETIAGINEEEASRTLLAQFVEFLSSTTKKVIGGALEIKGKLFANEIIIKDQSTGSPYCVTIVNGALMAQPGESCNGVNAAAAIVAGEQSQSGTTTPEVVDSSSSTATTTETASSTTTESTDASVTTTEPATSTDVPAEVVPTETVSASSTTE